MSLHTLANHMAAQGRNNDSMLVHMTPKEVSGLHALAAANGGQLTVNPETGLPEAGFLEDILPAVIGFGLDTFVPGLGEVVGGAFGLGAAAGTGIAVGGLTALATGNLSKGVMAGFGAYGGAGLAQGLMGAGTGELASQKLAEQQAAGTFPTLAGNSPEQVAAYANEVNAARSAAQAGISPMDKLTAGFSATTKSPEALLNFGKGNGRYLLAAAAPSLAGGFSGESQTVTQMPDNRMITPFVMNRKNLPYDESISPSGQRSYLSHGVTALTPVRAAEGGAVSHFDIGGGVREDAYGRTIGDPNFGKPSDRYEGSMIQGGEDQYGNLNGSDASRRAMLNRPPPADNTDEYTRLLLNAAKPASYRNTMTGESAKAFDYLMGNKASLPGTPVVPKPPRMPGAAALSTAGTSTLTPENVGPMGSRGLSQEQQDEKNDPNAWGNLTSGEQAEYYANNPTMGAVTQGLQKLWGMTLLGKLQNTVDPGLVIRSGLIAQGIDPRTGANMNLTPEQKAAAREAINNPVALPGSEAIKDMAAQYGMYNNPNAVLPGGQPSTWTGGESLATPNPVTRTPAAVTNLPSSDDYSNEGRNSGAAGFENNSRGGGYSGGYSGDNSGDNRGWGSRDAGGDGGYADGGVTGGGNIDLHVPINIGGGGQGGGFGGGNGIQQGGMPQPPMGGLGSLLGQTQPQSNAFGGGMGGMRSGLGQANQGLFGGTPMSKPSYEQYLAGRSPYQQDLQLSRAQYENPQQGPSTPGNRMAEGGMTGMADGGLGSLGGYSDGGRLLRGPGDGVSDSIPATIGNRQPARLADGEFVVPARIVSELGNGSTEAGARQLYAMMDRIQAGRKKTVGKGKVAKNTRSAKHLPA